MRKKLAVTMVLLLSISLLFLLIFKYADLLSRSPFKSGLPIKNLSTITSDANGNLYMVVEARKNIVKMDKNGICQYISKSDGTDNNQLYLFSDLAVDGKANLYVHRINLDSKGIYVEAESVLCFSPEGDLNRILYQIDYDRDNRPLRAGNIHSLQVKDGSLYFHYVQFYQDYLYRIDLENYSANESIVAYLPQDCYLSDIIGTDPGEIYYSTQRGEIYRIHKNGESKLLYPLETNLSVNNISSNEIEYNNGLYNQVPDRTFPVQLKLEQDKLFFIDTFSNEIRCLSTSGADSGSIVFSQETLGISEDLSVLKDMVVEADGSLTVAVRDRIYELNTNGRLINTLEKASWQGGTKILQWSIWILPLLILGLFVYLLRYIYREVMERKVSLIIKQIVVFTPIIILGMVFMSWFVYQQFVEREEKEVYKQLVVLTEIGLDRLDPMWLESINSPHDYMNEDYSALRNLTIESQIHRGSYGENKLDEAGLYTAIYKIEYNRLYAIVDYDNSVNMYRPITIAGEFKRVLDSEQIVTDKAADENGSWMFAMAPIFGSNGDIIGIFETGVDRSGFNHEKLQLFKGIAQKIGYITVAIIVIFLLVTYYLLLSIRKLRNSVADIAQGNWEAAVALDTGDEVADLGDSVNDMAAHIRNYIQEITDLSEAYYRFVPQQFLNLLGKKNIIDVELGDQVKKDMSILSLNIHSFSRLSGTMGPEDNFGFITSYLSWMGPIITDNAGLIDQYAASGFRALFPEQVDQAVQAAIELRKNLVDFNINRQKSGYVPINIGIGIHKGPLMMGIIGEQRRMAGTVISDDVNVAAWLQSLTDKFACAIIVSEDILKALDKPRLYQYRYLGKIRSEGRDETFLLYDMFEGETEAIRALKLESRELFEEGIALFQDGCFYDARGKFIDVIKRNRQDEIARIYFYLCEEYCKNGSPEGWDGTLLI